MREQVGIANHSIALPSLVKHVARYSMVQFCSLCLLVNSVSCVLYSVAHIPKSPKQGTSTFC